MGLWGAIKRTLNSTVGTKKIIPIDEQIASLKTLYASDNLYLTIEGSGATVSDEGDENTVKSTKSITLLQSGSIKLKCAISRTSGKRRAYFKIYKNGNLYQTFLSSSSDPMDAITDAIYLNRNDILEFEFTSVNMTSGTTAHNNAFSDIQILATLTDNVVNIQEV